MHDSLRTVLLLLLAGATSVPCRGQCLEWDGQFSHGPDYFVHAMTVFDDGTGEALYVGGSFTMVGGIPANRVAKWNGSAWSALGSGLDSAVFALTVFDDGGGPAVYAGCDYFDDPFHAQVAKWNGSTWSPLGSGVSGENPGVYSLSVFDDGGGPALYAGGTFDGAGGVFVDNIARWDGSSWSAVGTWSGVFSDGVRALAVADLGGGSALYAGGFIYDIPGRLKRWNGSTWSGLGSGVNGAPFSLGVFDDGGGEALYVGGDFTTAGGATANNVAKWNGSSWSPLGSGTNNRVNALAVFDDGSGRALYVAGSFSTAGGVAASHIAKWNGASWSALDGGVSSQVLALIEFDDGADGAVDLYAGGFFTNANGTPSKNIAEWHGCPPGDAYCFGDGLDPVVTADCPCGNFGDPGRGCANSNASLGGARLLASGTTNPNTVVLKCTGVNNNTLCTFLRGPNHDPQAAVFGDGINCIRSPIFRFGQQNSGQMGNAPFMVAAPAPSQLPGSTIHYAVQYRNPTAGFCDPGLFNASNGYTIQW